MNISDRLQTLRSRTEQYQPTNEELAAAKLVLVGYFTRCQKEAPTEVQARALDVLVEYLKSPTGTQTLEKALAFAKLVPNMKTVAPYIKQARSSAPPQVRRAIEIVLGQERH